MNLVYYVQNKINGKMYIGQTSMTIEKRWYFHCRENSHCKILLNAIKKYGKYNFTVNVFKVCDSKEEADQEESYWIEQIKPEYNIKTGGSRGKHSEETRKKIGLASLGNKYAIGMAPNKTSFKLGNVAPNKGRRMFVDELSNVRYGHIKKRQISRVIGVQIKAMAPLKRFADECGRFRYIKVTYGT